MRYLGILIVVVTAASAAFFASRKNSTGSHSLVVSPSYLRLSKDVLESENVQVRFDVCNRGRTPGVIEGASVSCGCSDLITDDGRELLTSLPRTLAPGATLPVTMSVNTRSRAGLQAFSAYLSIRDEGGKHMAKFDAQLYVLAGWRNDPLQILLTDDKPSTEQTVGVFDAFPDPGIAINDVFVSDDERMKVVCDPVPPGEQDVRGVVDNSYFVDNKFKRRYRVRIAIDPRKFERPFEEYVVLKSDGFQEQLRIPIIYSPQQQGFTFHPPSVIIPVGPAGAGRASDKITRSLVCDFRNPEDSSIELLEAPSYLNVDIRPVQDGARRIVVVCSSPPSPPPQKDAIRLKVRNTTVVEVPVKFVDLGTDQAAEPQRPEN